MVWSPRKRIKLSKTSSKSNQKSVKETSEAVLAPSAPVAVDVQIRKKRVSTDFVKELDECLDPGSLAFNPTQVFLVDPDMELAMLNVEDDAPPIKLSGCASVPASMATPLADTTNTMHKSTMSVIQMDNTQAAASQSTSPSPPTTTQLVDELEGIDLDQLTAIADDAELKYTQQAKPPAMGMFSVRCRILAVPVYTSDGNMGIEIVEDIVSDTSIPAEKKLVILQGVWRAAYEQDPWQITINDIIHILCASKRWEANRITVGDSSTLFPDIIVYHPDTVISSTTLSASATCHRRSVIQNRVLAPQVGPPPESEADINRALSPVIGNCVHEALQAAAAAGDFSQSFVLEAGEKSLTEQMLSSVWMCGGIPKTVMNQLRDRLNAISNWGRGAWPRVASRLRGCEVEIRPASLGVTGKLDMDIEDASGARSCIEIKTGKHHAIHVGQVVLYYLLQYVDKFGNPDSEFAQNLPQNIATEYLLLYLQSSHKEADMIPVKISPRECQNIMWNRNLIASHTVKRTLPEPIYKRGDCEFCPVRRECAVFEVSSPASPDWGKLSKSTQLQYRINRESLSDEEKKKLFGYLHAWLEWIDTQPTSAHGGLSAVRRMRGNILNMISHHLFMETGAHAGEELAFSDWIPALVFEQNPGVSQKDVPAIITSLTKSRTWTERNIGKAITLISPTDETCIASLVDLAYSLMLKDKRVLLCGSSHEAIDFIVEPLIMAVNEALRSRISRIASRPEDVRETVRPYIIPDDWDKDPEVFERSRLVVACTVKAVHHDLLSRGDFDCAVVVGANKAPDPLLWGVMVRARRIILIECSPKLTENTEDNNDKDDREATADVNRPVLPFDLLFKRVNSIRV